MSEKRFIVITSIAAATEAVKKFAALPDYQLIMAGDKKTPPNWQHPNTIYLPVDGQQQKRGALGKLLPYNSYTRKMFGYLEAFKQGADLIVDTDDDNIPKPDWEFPSMEEAEYNTVEKDLGMVNVYQLFTDQHIWPRGLPLALIKKDFQLEKHLVTERSTVGMWQGLADEDPDVDAIYRLTDNTPCYFNKREPVVLAPGTVCPCNTQNTLVCKEFFPLMYLPNVNFRFTDILRGLVAQPIMWQQGYRLGFLEATVIQKRNPHDYMSDFDSELPMYKYCESIVEWVQAGIKTNNSVQDNLHCAYVELNKQGVVTNDEIELLEAWLQDFETFSS